MQIQTDTGAKVDERRFHNDFFDMQNSGSTSVYDDLVALLSVSCQSCHYACNASSPLWPQAAQSCCGVWEPCVSSHS